MHDRDDKEILLTKEGLKKLVDELEFLKSTKREQLAERIKQAIAFGDLSENSEYEDAKNEQAFVEGRILNLENTLKNARLMETNDMNPDVISLGSKVVLQEMKSGREIDFTLVSSVEARLKDGKISNESPVGQAIIGKKMGSIVQVAAPAGTLEYKIISVDR
jgi:transcription elongation factor GreA